MENNTLGALIMIAAGISMVVTGLNFYINAEKFQAIINQYLKINNNIQQPPWYVRQSKLLGHIDVPLGILMIIFGIYALITGNR